MRVNDPTALLTFTTTGAALPSSKGVNALHPGGTVDVRRKDLDHVREVGLGRRPLLTGDASVVDQHIQVGHLGREAFSGGHHRKIIGDVQEQQPGAQLVRHPLPARLAACPQIDLVTQLDQSAGALAAQASGCTGDQRRSHV